MEPIIVTEENREQVLNSCTTVINGYKVVRFKEYENGKLRIANIRVETTERHQITIYADTKWTSREDFKPTYRIQTTSWGALPVEEIKKVVENYQTAIKTVEELEAFDWNNAVCVDFSQLK